MAPNRVVAAIRLQAGESVRGDLINHRHGAAAPTPRRTVRILALGARRTLYWNEIINLCAMANKHDKGKGGGNAHQRAMARSRQQTPESIAAAIMALPNRQVAEMPAVVNQGWYQSTLFWGLVGIAIAIVLTVVAAMKKDIRWLLWFAWPFAGLAVWEFLTYFHFARKRRVMIAACATCVVAVALYSLSVWLKPKPTPITPSGSGISFIGGSFEGFRDSAVKNGSSDLTVGAQGTEFTNNKTHINSKGPVHVRDSRFAGPVNSIIAGDNSNISGNTFNATVTTSPRTTRQRRGSIRYGKSY